MKKHIYSLIFFVTITLIASCLGESKKNSTTKNTTSNDTGKYSEFIISDTTLKIPIDTLNCNSPCLSISISLELAPATEEHAKNINNIITYAAYGNDTTPPATATEMFITDISNEYSMLRANYINIKDVNDAPAWLNHTYNINGKVNNIHNNIINYIIVSDIYTGGAPMEAN